MIKKYALLLVAAILITSVGCRPTQPVTPPKFDRQAWLDGKDDDSRQQMVDALEKELKPGMIPAEIVELLGEPASKIDISGSDDKAFIYILGEGLIDYEEYRIIFDADLKVKRYRRVQG